MTPAAASLDTFRRHGGRLAAAERLFPQARTPWLDLSTGINPRPYPAPRSPRRDLGRLPDPQALAALEATAAAAFGCAADHVAAVPGSEAAVRLLPRLLGATSATIAGPTYASHGAAWRAAGVTLVDDVAGAEAWIVVNPNNPDGAVTAPGILVQAARRRWVIVDEAFADAEPSASVASRAGGRLVVLRSFGKFYGLAGLRLGFVIADPAFIARLRAMLGDWPVTCDAIAAGRAAYADEAWTARTRGRLTAAARRLDRILTRAGLAVVGGAPLFRLTRTDDATRVFLRLATAGVLCRPFDHDHSLLRFGLPGPPSGWARLQAALAPGGVR